MSATTDLSWAIAVKGAKHILVNCHFRVGSKAKGCVVELTHIGGAYEMLHIPRLPSSHLASQCIKVSQSDYPILTVKDWKLDGRCGSLSIKVYTDNRREAPCELKLHKALCN